MKAIRTHSRLFLLALLAAAGCVGSAPSSTGQQTTNSALSTACQQAQDDCTSLFDALSTEGASLASTCQSDVTACQNAIAQFQQDAANATSTCNSEVSMDCDPGTGGSGSGTGGGGGSGTGSGSGSGGGSGAGSGGPSSACLMAIDSCQQDIQTLLGGTSLPDCGDAVVTACSDPSNASGCQSAIQACAGDAQNLQSQAGSDAAQCAQDIASACQ